MEEQNTNQENATAEIVNDPNAVEATDVQDKQEASSSEEVNSEQNSNADSSASATEQELQTEQDASLDSAQTEPAEETQQTNSEQESPKEASSEDVKDESNKVEASKEDAEPELGAGGLEKLSEEKEKFPWYVVHTYSGFEARVKIALLDRIRKEKAEDKFGHIIVPEENVTEMVKGEKKTSKKKFFPGYIIVQCLLDEHAWHLVTGTPKVTSFVGDHVNPSPLSPEEVGTLLQQIEGKGPKSRASVEFEQGDTVKVVDGPFSDFNGTVDDVKPDKGKLRVLISIFGRNTPVELDFFQVEKV